MSLIDLVQQHLGPNEMNQISQQLGVDNATATQAVQSALPSMVAGMAGQSQEPDGASSIQSLLGSHQGMLGSLGGLLGGAMGGGGGGGGGGGAGGLLGSILGRHEPAVHDQVQQSTGLDAGKSKQLLMILAPIVLAALAHNRSQAAAAGATPDVGEVLTQEAKQAQQHSTNVGGLLGSVLSHVEGRQR